MKLTPSHRLYGLGAILLVALTICSSNFSRTGEPVFIAPLAIAGVMYLLANRITRDLYIQAGLNVIQLDIRSTSLRRTFHD